MKCAKQDSSTLHGNALILSLSVVSRTGNFWLRDLETFWTERVSADIYLKSINGSNALFLFVSTFVFTSCYEGKPIRIDKLDL